MRTAAHALLMPIDLLVWPPLMTCATIDEALRAPCSRTRAAVPLLLEMTAQLCELTCKPWLVCTYAWHMEGDECPRYSRQCTANVTTCCTVYISSTWNTGHMKHAR